MNENSTVYHESHDLDGKAEGASHSKYINNEHVQFSKLESVSIQRMSFALPGSKCTGHNHALIYQLEEVSTTDRAFLFRSGAAETTI
jgi:hypothetical protein